MARVALLTMSDGRDFVARDTDAFCRRAEDAIASALEAEGPEVVRGRELEHDRGRVLPRRQVLGAAASAGPADAPAPHGRDGCASIAAWRC